MKKSHSILVMASLTMMAVGCGEDPDPTASPTQTATHPPATETPTPTATPSPSESPTPTFLENDSDGDGYIDDDDCAPNDGQTYPGAAEICDGVDNDCDETVDEGLPQINYYEDADFDGYGTMEEAGIIANCGPQEGYVDVSGDCDDTSRAVYPERLDTCDGVDNDCDDAVDENPEYANLPDTDGDGFGDANAVGAYACEATEGHALGGGDCDDSNAEIHPDADEIWQNETDENCNGENEAAQVYVVKSSADLPEDALDVAHFSTIQEAINEASSGMTIAVGPGNYQENINYLGKNLQIVSLEGPTYTIIDGRNGSTATVLMVSGEGTTSPASLVGFTITGGVGSDGSVCGLLPNFRYGGGICTKGARPLLENNHITDNHVSGSGGGLYLDGGVANLRGNAIWGNSAEYDGGGVNLSGSEGELVDNIVAYNTSRRLAGGIYVYTGTPELHNNYIVGNDAQGTLAAPAQGGGIYVQLGSPVVTNNVVAHNHSGSSGGGIAIIDEDLGGGTYVNNTIVGNDADGFGGGFQVAAGQPQVFNNLIAYNNAGVGPNVEVADIGSIISTYNLFYSFDGTAGLDGFEASTSDINRDPALVNDPTDLNDGDDNYHLMMTSAAIDAGRAEEGYNDADGTRNDLGAYGGPNGDSFLFTFADALSFDVGF